MRSMNKLIRFLILLPLVSALLSADVIRQHATISTSGTSTTIRNEVGAVTVSFEEIIAGAPATVSIVIAGCESGGTCTTLETNTSTTAGQIRTPTISTVYDYFQITASWTGGTNVSVQVNVVLTTAVNGSGGAGAGYPPAGIPNSTGSGWGSSYTVGSANGDLFTNEFTTLGDMDTGGASGARTLLPGPTGPNGVPQTLTNIPSGGAAAAEVWAVGGVPVDATNPATLLVTDRANYLNWTSGTALALPSIASAGFASNLPFVVRNGLAVGSGNTLVITPNAGNSDLIDGAATGNLLAQFAGFIYQPTWTSGAGAWNSIKFPTFGAFPACADSSGNHLNFSTTAGFSCGTTSSGAGSNWFPLGTDSGTGAAYVVTSTMSSLVAGNAECFMPANNNSTTTPTVAFNSLTAKTIVKLNSVALSSAPADMVTTEPACMIYDGTNFQLLNPSGKTGTGALALLNGPTFQGDIQTPAVQGGANTAVLLQSGQDANTTGASATLTVRGETVTAGSTASIAGGAVTVSGGDNGSSGATETAGALTLRGGDTTNGSAAVQTTGAVSIRGGNNTATGAGATLGTVTITGGSQSGAATNQAGATVTIQPGTGTGSATGANLVFNTPNIQASGTTAQTEATAVTIDQNQMATFSGFVQGSVNRVFMTADWTCGTGGTVSSCTSATIVGSSGTPLTITLPKSAQSWHWHCHVVVTDTTATPANNWNILTATNGATNVTASYSGFTAAAVAAGGATTDTSSTTSTIVIGGTWTQGAVSTKMPYDIDAWIEGAAAAGTVVSLQVVDPTVGDLLTIYRGAYCTVGPF